MIGVACKKNVEDIRESPAFKLLELLEKRGAVVEFYDPYVDKIQSHEHAQFSGRVGIKLEPTAVASYNSLFIVTDHDNIDYKMLCEHGKLIVDTRNACARAGILSQKVVKA